MHTLVGIRTSVAWHFRVYGNVLHLAVQAIHATPSPYTKQKVRVYRAKGDLFTGKW